jgi:hypothetical protein
MPPLRISPADLVLWSVRKVVGKKVHILRPDRRTAMCGLVAGAKGRWESAPMGAAADCPACLASASGAAKPKGKPITSPLDDPECRVDWDAVGVRRAKRSRQDVAGKPFQDQVELLLSMEQDLSAEERDAIRGGIRAQLAGEAQLTASVVEAMERRREPAAAGTWTPASVGHGAAVHAIPVGPVLDEEEKHHIALCRQRIPYNHKGGWVRRPGAPLTCKGCMSATASATAAPTATTSPATPPATPKSTTGASGLPSSAADVERQVLVSLAAAWPLGLSRTTLRQRLNSLLAGKEKSAYVGRLVDDKAFEAGLKRAQRARHAETRGGQWRLTTAGLNHVKASGWLQPADAQAATP